MSRPSTAVNVSRGSGTSLSSASPKAAGPATAADLNDGWERFWFTPEPAASLRIVRIAFGVLAALYFASHWADIGYWFAGEGVLSTEQLSQLSRSTEAEGIGRLHFTPLYWIESTLGLRLVLALGIVVSLLTAAGVGRWGIVALAWLTLLSVVARSWLITGLAELPLVIGFSGLMIAATGGGELWGRRGIGEAGPRRWTTGLARRLLEIHVSALVVATALTQLASESWWNGEGAVQLVLPIDGSPFELAALGNSRLAAAALTHLIVWLPLAAVPLLWFPQGSRAPSSGASVNAPNRLRRVAASLLIVHALILGVLSGHLLYEAAIAVLLSLFLVPRGPRGAEHREQG